MKIVNNYTAVKHLPGKEIFGSGNENNTFTPGCLNAERAFVYVEIYSIPEKESAHFIFKENNSRYSADRLGVKVRKEMIALR